RRGRSSAASDGGGSAALAPPLPRAALRQLALRGHLSASRRVRRRARLHQGRGDDLGPDEARATRASAGEARGAFAAGHGGARAVISGYAQTNIQRYGQLAELGYPATDVSRIHRGHGLAMQLFTGLFRGSGRPFLAHLVGTASVLASVRAPIEVVTAGLLHSAYSHGEFGNYWRGP